jgi:O-methyltransferase
MTPQDLSVPEFHGLTGARAARAVGPQPEAEALRTAYLELLKLALCDLVGSGTTSVGKWEGGVVSSREIAGDDLRLRSAGMDWPLHGLTMVGLNRLDDLQRCVESVVADDVDGDLIEAGAWRGGASILMRATLDSLGADRAVWVADSFQGFPAGDEQGDLNLVDFIAVPLAEVRSNFERLGLGEGVRFVPGFFEQTMPGLSGGTWSVVRLDGDTYEATWATLSALYPGLSVGGYLIVDDYGVLPECRRAVDDFREHHGITEPVETVDWTGVHWRREHSGPAPAAPAALPAPDPAERVQALPRERRRHVPTERELELAAEADRLRERLAAAEERLGHVEGSPVAGPAAWLRRTLRGRGRSG